MQAIILAAGMGKRLAQYTAEQTKCMVKVCGVSLIERLLNQSTRLDAEEVELVTNATLDDLKEIFKVVEVKNVII